MPPNYQRAQGDGTEGLGPVLERDKDLGMPGARSGICTLFLVVGVGNKEDAQGKQSGKRATHWLRYFGSHMAQVFQKKISRWHRLWDTLFSSVLAAEASLRQKQFNL